MVEGFFYVQFSTPQTSGAGVVHLKDGRVLGGDGALYYLGTYEVEGPRLTAEIRTARHTPGNLGLFGLDDVTIQFVTTIEDDVAYGEGKSPQAPDVKFTIRMGRLPEA